MIRCALRAEETLKRIPRVVTACIDIFARLLDTRIYMNVCCINLHAMQTVTEQAVHERHNWRSRELAKTHQILPPTEPRGVPCQQHAAAELCSYT
jgi:hypothetical protein